MAEEQQHRIRLGRGLAALLADTAAQMPVNTGTSQNRLPVGALRANPRNPRQAFDAADLDELTESIRLKGVLQPILVRVAPGERDIYEIIAGERRWRAAQAAGLDDVPAAVVEASDKEALELAIIENVQRSDLNAIEEAKGYARLSDEFGYSHSDLAKTIGKSRSHVANTIRLLRLPAAVTDLVTQGRLSAGHARALLSVDKPEAVAQRIVTQGLTVRDVENLVPRRVTPDDDGNVSLLAAPKRRATAEAAAIAEELSTVLGMAVTLDHRGTAGELRIRYTTMEQLHALCRQLRV